MIPAPSRLLVSLGEANARFPTERKLLVCRDRGEGRELLRALALRAGGWLGWEPSTLRDLAGELAFVTLADRGLRVLDDVEVAAVTGAALDAVPRREDGESAFRALADGSGFRLAVADTVAELRLANVSPRHLERSSRRAGRSSELARVYATYVAQLNAMNGADAATVFEAALGAFEAEVRFLQAHFFVVPLLRRRGLPGLLLERLLARGARTLEADVVHGLPPPAGLLPLTVTEERDIRGRLDLLVETGFLPDEAAPRSSALSWLHRPAAIPAAAERPRLELFRASSPAVELREVLRRVLRSGCPWDDVEIVSTDPVTYGCALDALTATLDVPVTFGVGLPLERSRLGRVMHAYFTWIERGFHARPLIEALLRGDLRPPRVEGVRPSAPGVARRLRELRIGWGHERYPDALERLRSRNDAPSRERPASAELDPDDVARRERRRSLERRSLELLLRNLVASIPAGIPREGGRSETRVISAGTLARSTLRFLDLFEARRGTEEAEAIERVRDRLTRVAAVASRHTTLTAALAELRTRVRLRIPRPGTAGPLPWTSAAGALHFTDVAHGGGSGRSHTYVVGLDLERCSAGGGQDPVLPDPARERLGLDPAAANGGPAALVTSDERAAERRYELAAMLASLRGSVTLSYAGWEAATGSTLSPDPVLLQALRVGKGDPTLSFEDLEQSLGEPVSMVPASGLAMDSTDVWLAVLAGSARVDGLPLVRQAFPLLASGLRSEEEARGDVLTTRHGYLPEVDAFDPRVRRGRAFSPSELQAIGRCPLHWFYKYALGVRKLDDPEYEPGRWLSNLERGTLLHRIYERFGRSQLEEGFELDGDRAAAALQAVVDEELARMAGEVPPPSSFARDKESEEIRRAGRLFLAMERDDAEGVWTWFEQSFGGEGAPTATVALPGGRSLPMHGKVDRVDRLRGGGLRVIDYKTGKVDRFDKGGARGPFAGGREIQPGVYVRAVEAALGERVRVFEYRFPTERGRGRIQRYDREQTEPTLEIARDLVALVEQGCFLATDDPADCRYCDHRSVCRVTSASREVVSPRAEWSRSHRDLPPYATLVRLRRKS